MSKCLKLIQDLAHIVISQFMRGFSYWLLDNASRIPFSLTYPLNIIIMFQGQDPMAKMTPHTRLIFMARLAVPENDRLRFH